MENHNTSVLIERTQVNSMGYLFAGKSPAAVGMDFGSFFDVL